MVCRLKEAPVGGIVCDSPYFPCDGQFPPLDPPQPGSSPPPTSGGTIPPSQTLPVQNAYLPPRCRDQHSLSQWLKPTPEPNPMQHQTPLKQNKNEIISKMGRLPSLPPCVPAGKRSPGCQQGHQHLDASHPPAPTTPSLHHLALKRDQKNMGALDIIMT